MFNTLESLDQVLTDHDGAQKQYAGSSRRRSCSRLGIAAFGTVVQRRAHADHTALMSTAGVIITAPLSDAVVVRAGRDGGGCLLLLQHVNYLPFSQRLQILRDLLRHVDLACLQVSSIDLRVVS